MSDTAFARTLMNARLQGREAMQALAEDHLPLVGMLVRRFPGYMREREELYQQGCVGLMKALARFDPERGIRFSTYAAAMILGEMRMLCRCDAPLHVPRTDREQRSRIRRTEARLSVSLGREPTVQELSAVLRIPPEELVLLMEDISVASADAHPFMTSLLPDHDDWMTRLMLRDVIARLPQDDQRLLLLRYHRGLTQAETARALGITQVRVSRREIALKAQLREAWQGA